MTRDTAKDFLPLVQALADGKVIQKDCGDIGGEIAFVGNPSLYRVKPEPREVWVNEYQDLNLSSPHSSRVRADSAADSEARIAVIRFIEAERIETK